MDLAVIVAQLAEQSLPTPDDPGLNQAIHNIDKERLFTAHL